MSLPYDAAVMGTFGLDSPEASAPSRPDGQARIAVVPGAIGYMGSNLTPALAERG